MFLRAGHRLNIWLSNRLSYRLWHIYRLERFCDKQTPSSKGGGNRSWDDSLEEDEAVTRRFQGMIGDKAVTRDLRGMVEGGVIKAAGPVAPAAVCGSSSTSAWKARPPHNVFKAERDISINTTANEDRETTKHGNELEICYSSVTTRSTRQTKTHNSHNRRPTTTPRSTKLYGARTSQQTKTRTKARLPQQTRPSELTTADEDQLTHWWMNKDPKMRSPLQTRPDALITADEDQN